MIVKIRKDAEGKVMFTEEDSTQQSSIKISQNAKGDRSFEVKVYADELKTMKKKLGDYVAVAEEAIANKTVWKCHICGAELGEYPMEQPEFAICGKCYEELDSDGGEEEPTKE